MDNTLGKPEILRFDEQVQSDFDTVQIRRREISSQLDKIYSEQAQIELDLGRFVAEGADFRAYTDRLAEIEREIMALNAGIKYLDDQSAIIKRTNTWLTNR